MNRFSKTILTSLITGLGINLSAMSMDLKSPDDTNSTKNVSSQVIEQPAVKKSKNRSDSAPKKKNHSTHSHTTTVATNAETIPLPIFENQVINTVEVIKEAIPVKVIDLKDLSTELSTIIDKGQSCCLWCISETTRVAQNLNELVAEISKLDQAIESNVTAVTQLVDTVKDFNKLTPKEQQLQKNNLKVNMKNAKAELEHHKILQKNKTTTKKIEEEI